ncbi:hypothetical protein K450DRAFT_267203 [Umbelopsis ramanniana AG]|uniref:GAR domain-containing protein n=1 Tax=Umbelopsis ramanniana AG TaxID=1314678 RepID=A0AAD5HJA2_UMBRA|nr:uncharacterized protein K450DRAFT_267203 [Umbelopsis ramanniana AG]KAI8584536.1 hypothetical protein K450DRAFT_267203 [Umbelopsis ramanniana AG]
MACSYPFVDHGTPLWIDVVANTSDKAEVGRRRTKCHAIVDNLNDGRGATVEHESMSIETPICCTKDLKTQNPYLSSIIEFSKMLPNTSAELGTTDGHLDRSLVIMNAILTPKSPLVFNKPIFSNGSEDGRCDPVTTQAIKCKPTYEQENEQVYLSIGHSLRNTMEVNDQVPRMQTPDQTETLSTFHAMEELLMGILDHLEFAASLHLPSITWDNDGSISAICASRLSRMIQQLGIMPSAAPLTSSLPDNDQQHSDMAAFQQLMISIDLINQWLCSEIPKIQEGLKDMSLFHRTQLMATICDKLTQTVNNAKINYSSFQSSVIELRQQFDSSRRHLHLVRCPNTCYTDRTVTCEDLRRKDYTSQPQNNTCNSNNTNGDKYEILVLALEEGINGWVQECDMFEHVLQNSWSNLATANLDSATLDRLAHLETHLHGIKSSVESARLICVQDEHCGSKAQLLSRLRESQIQIMDVEPRFERICQRVQVLAQCKRWEGLYNDTMAKMACTNGLIDELFEMRSTWASHLNDTDNDQHSAKMLVQKGRIESALQDMKLSEVADAILQFEETLITAMFKLPNRMHESQQILVSLFTNLQSRLQFTSYILQQYQQVSKLQTDVTEIQSTLRTFKTTSTEHHSIAQLDELCKMVVTVGISGHTSIHYPESTISSEVRRNKHANQHVRSGIGTMQMTLMSILEDLRNLMDDHRHNRELQHAMEQMKVTAGRQIRLLQSRIASLEDSPINPKARMSIQELNDIISDLQYQRSLAKQTVVICSPPQLNLLQSCEEGKASYNAQKNLVMALMDRLGKIQSKRRELVNMMMTRAAWEARYEECAVVLEKMMEELPNIIQMAWQTENKTMDMADINLAYVLGSMEDKLLEEKLAFDAFITVYSGQSTSCRTDEELAIILSDAGDRHANLVNMVELLSLTSSIQIDRLNQRYRVQALESTYNLFMAQLDELYTKLQCAMSNDNDRYEEMACFDIDVEEMKSKIQYFDQQCIDDALYPDCQQHSILPHAYILDLMDSNRQVRQYINQLQDTLCKKLKTIIDNGSHFTELGSLLQDQVCLQQRYQDCHTKILARSSDYALADEPVPQDVNSTLALVQCLSVQSEVQTLSDLAQGLSKNLLDLATKLLQHDGTNGSYDALNLRSSRVSSMAKRLGLAYHKLVSTTLAMHLRQIWEARWNASKEKLEQCILQLDGSAQSEKLLDGRCASTDSAEQIFRELIQTNIASTNFAFRNLSKAYEGLGEATLTKLQQKHCELRRLISKFEAQLAKMRGCGEHMNSRARKLSHPNQLEMRARKISLPSRKTSNLGTFNDHLVASRSAVVSSRSSSTRSRPSVSSRSGPKSARQIYIPDPANVLDVELGRIINESPYRICVKAVPGEVGRYWFGESQPKLAYCRILKSSMVMVRVGGGWAELTQFLRDHALLEENFIPRERSFTEDEGLREGFIRTHRNNAPLGRVIKTHTPERGIKNGDRFIVGNGIEVKMKRAQDERTVPRSSRVNLLQN